MGNDLSKLQKNAHSTSSLNSWRSRKSTTASGGSTANVARIPKQKQKPPKKNVPVKNTQSFTEYELRKKKPRNSEWKEEKKSTPLHMPLKAILDGNFKSPVHNRLMAGGMVLDVGTGPALWGMDVAKEYERSHVIGVDINDSFINVGAKIIGRPSNFTFEKVNIFEPMPFPDGYFDLTFSRMMVMSIPRHKWPSVLSELVRVTKPGGFIELVEINFQSFEPGPIHHIISEQTSTAMTKRANLDPDVATTLFHKLSAYSDLLFVNSDHVPLPVGWDGVIGDALVEVVTNFFQSLADLGVMDATGITQAEFPQMVHEATFVEGPLYQTYYNLHWAFAQKSMFCGRIS